MRNLNTLFFILLAAVAGYSQVQQRPRIVKDKKPVVIKTTSVRPAGGNVFVATAYSLRGRTASGEYVREGIIAADPKVLPIGTIVYIEGMGQFIVKDTGGAIKGNRVDIWMPSTRNAMKFGKRKVKLTIISKAEPRKKKSRKK